MESHGGDPINQDEINRLLAGAGTPPSDSRRRRLPRRQRLREQVAQADVEALLKQALEGAAQPQGSPPTSQPPAAAGGAAISAWRKATSNICCARRSWPWLRSTIRVALPADLNIKPFQLKDFSGAPASKEVATLALVRDVELDVKIELGRTQMYLDDVLRLHKGSVVPLDKLAGDPVDIFVNGRLIARGEVLVLNDNFCVPRCRAGRGRNIALTHGNHAAQRHASLPVRAISPNARGAARMPSIHAICSLRSAACWVPIRATNRPETDPQSKIPFRHRPTFARRLHVSLGRGRRQFAPHSPFGPATNAWRTSGRWAAAMPTIRERATAAQRSTRLSSRPAVTLKQPVRGTALRAARRKVPAARRKHAATSGQLGNGCGIPGWRRGPARSIALPPPSGSGDCRRTSCPRSPGRSWLAA